MRKLLILGTLAALIIFLVQSPLVKQWLSSGSQSLQQASIKFEQHQSRLAARKLLSKLHQSKYKFSDIERQYLETVTASLDSLSQFQARYCLGADKNAIIYGHKLQFICTQTAELLAP